MTRTIPCPSCGTQSVDSRVAGVINKVFPGANLKERYCRKCKISFTVKLEARQKPGHPEVVTLSGAPRCKDYDGPAPCPIDEKTGMHQDYWVLSEEERAKGFVKPVRRSYQHVGKRPKHSLRDLTEEEKVQFEADKNGYVKYEEISSTEGRFWTAKDLVSGCGVVTYMGIALAETYARNPHFYGATFCCGCRTHFPLEEFVWINVDGTQGEIMDPNISSETQKQTV